MAVTGIEFVAPPTVGRLFTSTYRVRLGDINPAGRLRIDAIARILQDVSADDTAAADAALDPGPRSVRPVWILRRLAIEVGDVPSYRADLELRTWCSGIGPRWAERRTDLLRAGAPCVRAAAIWACTDAATGAPCPLPDEFRIQFAGAADDRKVSARLRLDGPEVGLRATPWTLRATDFDALGHVNNANYWVPLEDSLVREAGRVESALLEFRGGVGPGDDVVICEQRDERTLRQWWVANGVVAASLLVSLTA